MPARKQAVRNPETWESAVSWKPREPRVHRGRGGCRCNQELLAGVGVREAQGRLSWEGRLC